MLNVQNNKELLDNEQGENLINTGGYAHRQTLYVVERPKQNCASNKLLRQLQV